MGAKEQSRVDKEERTQNEKSGVISSGGGVAFTLAKIKELMWH